MTKTIAIRLALAAAALAAPAAALAHPGDHSAMSAEMGLRHLLSAPDHVAEMVLLTALIAGAGLGWRRLVRRVRR